jgi:SulP family sulfate permease
MTSVFVVVMAGATHQLGALKDVNISLFLNLILLLTAIFLLCFGLLRLGRWITMVPNVVISGFMDGIALIIWISQIKTLLRAGTSTEGSMLLNVAIVLGTLLIAFAVPYFFKKRSSKITDLFSGTFIALVTMTILCSAFNIPIERITSGFAMHSWSDFATLLAHNAPHHWPWHLTSLALPWALQLAMVAYLDILLTSVIIDRMIGEKSQKNRELVSQGMATAVMACIGGIPGAQATERSVLLIKEGSRSRVSGVFVGIFCLIGIFLFQDVIGLIPTAVFSGILIKIGYDVFDWKPFVLFFKQKNHPTMKRYANKHNISHVEIMIIIITAVLIITSNMIIAVIASSILFHMFHRWKSPSGGRMDLQFLHQTEGFIDEP